MHILLTGATGYIGRRLLNVLLYQGHEVTCCVRNTKLFQQPEQGQGTVHVLETDFNEEISGTADIKPVDAAYYLIHSLARSTRGYAEHEKHTATNFRKLAEQLKCKQVVYLSGISNEKELSEHLTSRMAVEEILKTGDFATTILRAGIIVGSGSASFEIIRDLIEKLPVMVVPCLVNTKCQPIAVKNVIQYLTGVLGNPETFHKTFDIGGPDILTYKQMMLDFASVRNLKRRIYTIPIMTPRLSLYWLYFVTATNYTLAVNLVKSMKVEVVCKEERLQQILQLELISYKEAVRRAFGQIKQNMVVSSWIDAISSSSTNSDISAFIRLPEHGCLIDQISKPLIAPQEQVLRKICSIGGDNGWYYASALWTLRGFMDKLVGGVGLRRGRKNQTTIFAGDALDFWRVLVADKEKQRLLLFAEMKLPGEAWLEFRIETRGGAPVLLPTATFRPRGITGRLYWYLIRPFNYFVFNGMAKAIARG
ncbi:MAG: SDR family oxidoreductase [Bacteroidales bacterium]|nr:SDR family oxidoreductase [Bacteroidales bacterium]